MASSVLETYSRLSLVKPKKTFLSIFSPRKVEEKYFLDCASGKTLLGGEPYRVKVPCTKILELTGTNLYDENFDFEVIRVLFGSF